MNDPHSGQAPATRGETSAHDTTRRSAAKGIRATLVGLLVSALLASAKIVAGILGSSYALIADGVESVLDMFSSLVVWGGLKIASIPPDDDHPYGHGKAESLGALIVAVTLLVAAVGIAIQSGREILAPHHAPEPFTLVVLVVVVATKEVLFRVLVRTGEAIGSHALKTDAWHHRSDALTSAAAFIGISIALVAGEGYESADDWAALFACAVIAYNGVRLLRAGLDEVMDVAPPPQIEERIREISEGVPGVEKTEKCRVRKSGLALFAELHVMVDGELSVRRGHDLAHEVKDALLAGGIGLVDVSVHVEPWDGTPGSDGAS